MTSLSKNTQRVVVLLTLIECFYFISSAQIWTIQRTGSQGLVGVSFCDTRNGFAVGFGGAIFRTIDGGMTWTEQESRTTERLEEISCVDSQTATAVGWNGTIVHTTDGGTTWISQVSGTTVVLNNVSFANPRAGVAVGYEGTALYTSDGGMTWADRYPVGLVRDAMFDVSMQDSLTWTLVGWGRILRTTDAGENWEYHSFPAIFWSITYVDSLTGFICGYPELLLQTTDGGISWSSTTTSPHTYTDLSFSDRKNGTVVGYSVVNQSRYSIVRQTTDGGSTWGIPKHVECYGVSAIDSNTVILVGGNVSIFRSTSEPPPPMSLAYPPDDEIGQPLSLAIPKLFSFTFRWHYYRYTDFDQDYFRIQIATDSTFNSGVVRDAILETCPTCVRDTTLMIYPLQLNTKYYWRMDALFDNDSTEWSSTWNFTTFDPPDTTITQIQVVPQDSLVIADSLQDSLPERWILQRSPLYGSFVMMTVRCVIPPTILKANSYNTMIAYDTKVDSSRWHGIFVQANSVPVPGGFSNIRQGDMIHMGGYVYEMGYGMNSTTYFNCHTLSVKDSGGLSIIPSTVKITDFYESAYPAGKVKYTTGEQYEGMLVELHDVTVHSIANANDGTFNISDPGGNILTTSDLSRWFTLRGDRDSSSTYSIPPVGAHIDTIRGVITTSSSNLSAGNRYLIAPIYPDDIVFGPPTRGAISGVVFEDLNRDSVRNPDEPPLSIWRIDISGKVGITAYTNADGEYFITGLDSGTYVINQRLSPGYKPTMPRTGFYQITLGIKDTVVGKDFSSYYPWNSISGSLFDDRNENGVRDSTDPWLDGWQIVLTGSARESLTTDSLGRFVFRQIDLGTYCVNVSMPPGWEQMLPHFGEGYSYTFNSFGQDVKDATFPVHRIPQRVRLALTVRDNSSHFHRDIWWGNRPGASYGIWGIDSEATNADFSEGEFEVPPPLGGGFDARFIDPHPGRARFGYGSWTDMRAYLSKTQADTHFITFAPSVDSFLNYPMTFHWSKGLVESLFAGPVTLVDPLGVVTDMKAVDSFVIDNPDIASLHLIAEGPLLPPLAVGEKAETLPREYLLEQNYPNPFNPVTIIHYSLPERARVKVSIFDVIGRELVALVDGMENVGQRQVEWDASRTSSGIYFYRMTATSVSDPSKSFTQVRKMLLIK